MLELDEEDWLLVLLLVVVVEDVVEGAHDSETFATGPVTGSDIADSGVPGATFTLKESVCPLRSLTVTTHWSAEAVGIAAIPITASATHAEATATTSFRLLNTLGYLLPP